MGRRRVNPPNLFHLTHLNDGETLQIGGYSYRVNGGQFIQLE